VRHADELAAISSASPTQVVRKGVALWLALWQGIMEW
jgi:hypothetical protein